MLLTAIIGIAALVAPTGLLAPGVEGFEMTKPFWPFLWVYASENLFGMAGMLIAPGLLFGFLALVPFSDRGPGTAAKITKTVGLVLFGLIVLGILYAKLAPGQTHLGM